MSIINRFPSGGGGLPAAVSRSDVNFYDYDGTLLYSYTIAQANALTALPAAPTHTGLTFQEWNYTLVEINATTLPLDVGTTYITDDGKTRLYIHVENTARATVPLYWSQTVANGVTIEFGDNTNPGTYSGTGNLNTTHTYAAAGDYIISLYPAVGCVLSLGNGNSTTAIIGGNSIIYKNMLKAVEIGLRVSSIADFAFYYCRLLSKITLPNSVTSIAASSFGRCRSLGWIVISRGVSSLGNGSFYGCTSLTSIGLPSSVATIAQQAFQECLRLKSFIIGGSISSIAQSVFSECECLESVSFNNTCTVLPNSLCYACYSLKSFHFPSNAQSIGENTFAYNYGLSTLTIPNSVTSIADAAFPSCSFMKEYHFQSTTPPSLGGSSVFYSIPSDCVIYVPTASVDTYKAASYWSAHASKITGE